MFRAIILSTALALAAPAAPAVAGGTFSLTLNPRSTQEADALRLGITLYALRRHVEAGGSVRQFGRDNAAALTQRGGGHLGLIEQRGDGHSARLTQRGQGQTYAIIQSGRGTSADVRQYGRGDVGLTIQHGW